MFPESQETPEGSKEQKLKALFMQHDHVSPVGLIGEAFVNRGYEIETQLVVPEHRYTSPNVEFNFPDPSKFDVIVPMGSPWGAWDNDTIGNWLEPELQWLRDADDLGIPVFGICFGGQLLARAHGGKVFRAQDCEIGWTHVWTEDPGLVSDGPWFSFHYDRFTVPPGAREIARTARAPQAFVLRKNLALQFHPEVDGDTLVGWNTTPDSAFEHIERDGQDPEVLVAMTRAEETKARERAQVLVDAFLDQVAR